MGAILAKADPLFLELAIEAPENSPIFPPHSPSS
jgi:hypothetical protein